MDNVKFRDFFRSYNLFYFFCVILLTARATIYTRSFNGYQNDILLFTIPFLMSVIFVLKNRVFSYTDRKTVILFSIYIIWFLLQMIKYGNLNIALSFYFFYQLIVAYSLVKVFRKNFFLLYESLLVKLSFICLICWALNLLFPTIIDALVEPISIHNKDGIIKYNILVASFLNEKTQIDQYFRNPGFSWEPGMNASLICIAILFNLLRTKFRIRKNRNLLILTCALLSSFSTTGYFVLLCIIVPFIFYNISSSKKYIFFPFFFFLLYFSFQLDFMGEKILGLQSSVDSRNSIINNLEYMETSKEENYTYVPQRFDGLAFECINIYHDPILGYGIDVSNSYVKKYINSHIALSDGNLILFSKFGLIFGSLLLLCMCKNFQYIATIFKVKGSFFFLFFWVAISMSYSFIDVPYCLGFFFYYYFTRN